MQHSTHFYCLALSSAFASVALASGLASRWRRARAPWVAVGGWVLEVLPPGVRATQDLALLRAEDKVATMQARSGALDELLSSGALTDLTSTHDDIQAQLDKIDHQSAVDAQLAAMKAQMPVKGCVMASDAFFPFRDGLDAAAQVGITAVIQPGGSIRDAEVVKAADEHGMAMILTGMRHFRH